MVTDIKRRSRGLYPGQNPEDIRTNVKEKFVVLSGCPSQK